MEHGHDNRPRDARRLIDLDALQVGDVVLVQGSGGLARTIMAVDGGGYHHAMVCCDPGVLIEAVRTGVRKKSLANCHVGDPTRVRILRPLAGFASDQARANFGHEANRLYASAYSWQGAVGAIIPAIRRRDDTALFCSQIAARCYAAVGMTVFEGWKPEEVTPAVIEACPQLVDITAKILRSPWAGERVPPDLLDEGLPDTPMDEYQALLTSIHAQVFPEAVQAIPPQARNVVGSNLGTLHGLVVALASLKLLALGNGRQDMACGIDNADQSITEALRARELRSRAERLMQPPDRPDLGGAVGEIERQLEACQTHRSEVKRALDSRAMFVGAGLSSLATLDEIDRIFLKGYYHGIAMLEAALNRPGFVGGSNF